jgi:hypothetical protein
MKISDHEGYLKQWATGSEDHFKKKVSSILYISGKSISTVSFGFINSITQ